MRLGEGNNGGREWGCGEERGDSGERNSGERVVEERGRKWKWGRKG